MTSRSKLAGACAALLVSERALACAVCGGGGGDQRVYLDMTIFMSLLPLGLIGGMAGLVWYRYRSNEGSRAEDR